MVVGPFTAEEQRAKDAKPEAISIFSSLRSLPLCSSAVNPEYPDVLPSI
jgi:hypothetical protein